MIRKYQNGGGQVVGLGSNPLSGILNQLTPNISEITATVPTDQKRRLGSNMTPLGSQLISSGLNLAGELIPDKDYSGTYGDTQQTLDSAYNSITDMVSMIPGVGQAASFILQGAGLASDLVSNLGGGTDNMTAVDAILGSSFLQLTPFGLINGFGGKKADTITKNQEAFEQVGSSYGGTSATVDDALTKSGKKYGLFSRGAMNEANQEIAEAKRQQSVMADIADTATDRRNLVYSMSDINGNRRAYQLQGGYQQGNIRVGKNGMNIDLINRAKQILSYTEIEPVSPQLLSKFKEGGSINVIPDGALHARKHNMDIEGITKKGIPVVSENKDGEIEQQAEIEKEEIILRLEVTQKLEELAKEGTDEAALEAGKLLVEEILYNTDDKANLINRV